MKAAVVREHGSIVFEERPIPTIKENELLIEVRACGLNHLDVWVRKGVSGHKFPLPLVLGSDFTGIISKIGSNVSGYKIGNRVVVDPSVFCNECEFCLKGQENLCSRWGLRGESQDGGLQEYVAVPASNVHLLPNNVNFEHGACIPVAYVTAWHMLVQKAKIKEGDKILIHAAGSGVSVACIQIAKLFKAQIYVTSTSEEKLQRAKILGAHRFINTSKDSFRESIKLLTNKRGVDIVVDHIGAPTLIESLKCLRKGGKLVSCGATAGSDITLDWKLIFFKNLELLGSTYGTRSDFTDVLNCFEKGYLTTVVDKTFAFNELPAAHQALEERKVFGKAVIVL